MSMETLREDLKAITPVVAALHPDLATTAEVVKALKEVWAFVESHVDETEEIDEVVADIVSDAEDILHPDTAKVFAAIIAGGAVMAAAIEANVSRDTNPQLFKAVEEFTANCKKGKDLLEEIVIDTGDDDDDDDEEDEDEDDDEDEGAA